MCNLLHQAHVQSIAPTNVEWITAGDLHRRCSRKCRNDSGRRRLIETDTRTSKKTAFFNRRRAIFAASKVFAFALILLVVSLQLPKSFADLIGTMRGFPAFALCFTVLATIWNTHYKFSLRYGLDDAIRRFLTSVATAWGDIYAGDTNRRRRHQLARW